jgi:hypothetical protein
MSPSWRNRWSLLLTSQIGNRWSFDPTRQITFFAKRAMLHRIVDLGRGTIGVVTKAESYP